MTQNKPSAIASDFTLPCPSALARHSSISSPSRWFETRVDSDYGYI